MTEGTYEYECMRAELLGIEKPDYDEFLKKQKELEAKKVEEEEVDSENLKEAEAQNEHLGGISGGLEELNSILAKTQKKIDSFKVRCGSITTLIKSKVGSFSLDNTATMSAEEATKQNAENSEDKSDVNGESPVENCTESTTANQRKSDLTRALDNHTDKLDAMLEKAENAHYSMSHQNKQMKKFLK